MVCWRVAELAARFGNRWMLQRGDAERLKALEAKHASMEAGFKRWILDTERDLTELKKSRDAAVDAVNASRAGIRSIR